MESKHQQITDAIEYGIERAKETGYTKPYDVAIAVKVELEKHFRILWKVEKK